MSEAGMEAQDEADVEAPRRGSSRVLVIVLAVVVVSAIAGWFAYSYLDAQKAEQAQAEARKAAAKKAAAAKPAPVATPVDDDAKLMADLQRQKAEAEVAQKQAQDEHDRVARELEQLQAQGGKGKRKK